MIEDHARGRNLDPRPQPAVTRRPSPSLAARIKMLEADAEKRNGNNSRLSPSPSPHRSQSSVRARSVSAVSDLSGVSSTIEVPTSIPMTHTIFSNGDAGTPALKPPNELPPTPVEDESGSLPLSLLEENKLQKSFSMTNECPPSPRTLTPTVECYSIDTSVSALAEEFNSYMSDECGLHRRSSVLSLSRISFAAQLSRLTSLSLPLSEDLSDRIRNLATSVEMCDALMSAGEQIGRWIDTAKKVLRGLDAEDDVEWAAQGRESLNEVDAAVKKFSGLMNVYIELIDELQSRPDTESVNSAVLLDIVNAMESTHDGWKEVEVLLSGVKGQVETAMEWTELSTTILQDIQAELDACQTLVFELEEKRHRSRVEEQGGSVDIETLETIMEENPGVFPIGNPKTANEIEDSSLLGLFARMQPLRASLDFLPMRLQSFQMRAQGIFPSACNDLESRRKQLEKKWKKLNSDGDNLKKELGEDRWVSIFRNAGKQATAMLDSIERSMNKLKESVILWEESGCRAERDLMKKMENYEAKKIHYGAAIQRTFSIIGKGISDRFTVNGEITRLDASLRIRWKHLEDQMVELDQTLKDLQLDTQALRDSLSTLTSFGVTSSANTPGSSPASSVVLQSPRINEHKRSPGGKAIRPASAASNNSPVNAVNLPKRSSYCRASSASVSTPSGYPWDIPTPSSSIRSVSSPSLAGSTASRASSRASAQDNRPRWNGSTKTDPKTIGHNFKPLTLTTPSPYRKTTPPSSGGRASGSRIPLPSPLSQNTTSLSTYYSSPNSLNSNRLSIGSTNSSYNQSPSPPTRPPLSSRLSTPECSRPSLRQQKSMARLSTAIQRSDIGAYWSSSTRQGLQYHEANGDGSSMKTGGRPASAMNGNLSNGSSRRASMAPRSPSSQSGKRFSLGPSHDPEKPRWRH